jgi:thioredoxin 1
MPFHVFSCSRRFSKLFAILLFLLLVGCGLADKQRSDLARQAAKPENGEATPAPVVLASEVDAQDTEGKDFAALASFNGAKPKVIPAGSVETEDASVSPPPIDPESTMARVAGAPTLDVVPSAERGVLHANADDFQDVVLKSDEVVLVDFYADSCGPCKKQAPILEQYAKTTPDVRVVKVNTEKSRRVAKEYKVKRLPTLMVFRNGKPVDQHTGLVNQASIEKLVSRSEPE